MSGVLPIYQTLTARRILVTIESSSSEAELGKQRLLKWSLFGF